MIKMIALSAMSLIASSVMAASPEVLNSSEIARVPNIDKVEVVAT